MTGERRMISTAGAIMLDRVRVDLIEQTRIPDQVLALQLAGPENPTLAQKSQTILMNAAGAAAILEHLSAVVAKADPVFQAAVMQRMGASSAPPAVEMDS